MINSLRYKKKCVALCHMRGKMETSKLEYVNISPYSSNWLRDGWGSLPDCDSNGHLNEMPI